MNEQPHSVFQVHPEPQPLPRLSPNLPVVIQEEPKRPSRRVMRTIALVMGGAMAMVLLLIVLGSFLRPISTLMIAEWIGGNHVTRYWRSLEQISPNVMRALVAAEDGRFCDHHGVDWKAMRHAVQEAVEDDGGHGASTIPMQTAKNLFLWHGRSYVRKAVEIPLALLMDAIWSKRRMMEVYLNMAEWGKGTFGVEAASYRYFKKSARTLNIREAALLVAILPNPVKRDPVSPSKWVNDYANRIMARMNNGVDLQCVQR